MKLALGAAMLAVAALSLNACASSPPATFTAADDAEIRALFDSTVSRVRAKDWTAWAGAFTDSAIFHPSNGKALHGRPAILAWGQAFPPLEEFGMRDIQVWGEGNLAYGTSALDLKIKDAPADTAKQLVVFRRAPTGRWEVAAVSVTSDLPLPTPAPVASQKK